MKYLITTALLLSCPAFADATFKTPMIQLGSGYEYETLDVTVPKGAPGGATHASDSSRSGARLEIGIDGFGLDFAHGEAKIRFVPLLLVVDPNGQGDGFGRVSGYDGKSSPVRRVIGALVDGTFRPGDGMLFLRGKLASVDYDRDRGIWDWRAIDAEIGLDKAWKTADGKTQISFKVSVGAGAGGVVMNDLGDVQRALDVSKPINSAITIDPRAMIAVGLKHGNLKLDWVTEAEQRVDLSSGSGQEYLGRAFSANSEHLRTGLDLQYTLVGDAAGASLSFFVSGSFEYDNLTLSNALFGTGDSFKSFMVMAGLRGTF
jgi:hypothetical protein